MTNDDVISGEKPQYNMNREAAKTSVILSNKLTKLIII